MRILFISQLLPLPLDAGPKIRSYYVLRYLAEAGHDVTLLTFVRSTDREEDVRELGTLCSTVETVLMSRSRTRDAWYGMHSLLSSAPFLILRDRSSRMSERLERITNRQTFDAVHADQLWMAPYANDCQGVGLKVLDQHNAVFKVPERLAENQRNPILQTLLRREASKLASFEEATIDRFDRVVWVSEDDRASFPAAGNGAALRHPVIPIAVDPSARLPLARPRPFRVTFLGGLHWPPNGEGVKWFAERVWPRVSAAVPGCVFTVIGKGGNGLLDTNPKSRIEVTGYVSAVEPYLSETSAFVVPLLTGAGMRVKILDAWSWGLPVVSTSIGAEGIKVADGQNLLLADDEEAFADSLVRVLQDSRLAASLSANGRATVESLYDWRTVYRAWDQVYS